MNKRIDGEPFGTGMRSAERGSCVHCKAPVLCDRKGMQLAHREPTCLAFFQACEQARSFDAALVNYEPPIAAVLS